MDYDHEKILEIFETMNNFSNEFLVQKEAIEFLTPYIKKVEASVEQIPIMQPAAVPQDPALETLEKKIQGLEKMILET